MKKYMATQLKTEPKNTVTVNKPRTCDLGL